MKQSYLIQRLLKPYPDNNRLNAVSEAFAFGGGLRNGGLSDEAMKLLRVIFRFDYMGSAEFEFGAVPEALNKIASNIAAYSKSKITIKSKSGNKKDVYFLCQGNISDKVHDIIKKFGYSEYSKSTPITKERVMLENSIDGKEHSPCGWLELDNGFMFFTDKEMFEKTCHLFGVE